MKRQVPRWARALHRSVFMILAAAVLSGCTLRLVSGGYDEETDRSVMALQRKIETFLVKLEELEGSLECGYDHHKAFYASAKVEVSALHVRTAALSEDDTAAGQVELLSKGLGSLEQLHKLKLKRGNGKNCLSKEEIAPLRESFNAAFISLLKLELTKKQGR
ncbi:MAG TPA: hypothetical protein VFA47_13020 [Candidatus Manganitrophaceae bacterium]|nr:hypothetical protein [Candidatus Manganitrophaceae bacterium]